MGKGKIFQALDKIFIQELFRRKKKLFFSSTKAEISDVKVEKISPDWAKESCLTRYEILFSDGAKRNVRGTAIAGKSKKSVWKIMSYLYSRDFSSGDLRIARPLDYIENINLSLYEESPGVTLTEVIRKGSEAIIKQNLKKIARWLTKLHNVDFEGKKFAKAIFIGLNGYKRIFQEIGKYTPQLKKDFPAPNKLNFINRIWLREKKLIHNDFYTGNSVSDGEIVSGIDFDRVGVGPSLMDVATFYGALDFPREILDLGLHKKQSHRFQEFFFRQYCEERGLNQSQTKQHLKKFLVKICLDQIYYYAAFTIKGWSLMDWKTKNIFISKIRALLSKTNQYLDDL